MSISRIVLPVDFSIRSMGAARYAEALAEQYGAEVHMLHVIPPPHYEFAALEAGSPVLSDLEVDRRGALDRELNAFLTQELPGLNAKRVLLEGDPARTIVSYAHDQRGDLIVLPTHGYGPFRRFILGSVTAKVLHDADCPVWTGVHLEEAPAVDKIQFGRVVVAVDLGSHSAKTLCWAAQFAAEHQAKLAIVHATASLEGEAGEYFDPHWRQYLKEQAAGELAALQEKIGTRVEEIIEAGDVPRVICEVAAKQHADLLVIGRGTASGVFGRLRANAYAIIRQSPCPVASV